MSVFQPITPFSFTTGPGNALRKTKSVQNCSACRRRKTKCDRLWPCTPCKDRGEANLCEQYVKEPSDRPTGYTHVLDTSILANRVAQLEQVLSRLLTRVDSVDAYQDLLTDFKDPLPTLPPKKKDDGKGRDTKPSVDGSDNGMDYDDMDMAMSSTRSRAFSNATAPESIKPAITGLPRGANDTVSPDMLGGASAVAGPSFRPGQHGQQMTSGGVSLPYLTPGAGSTGGEGNTPQNTWFPSFTPSSRAPMPDAFASASHIYDGGGAGNSTSASGFASKAPSAHEHDAALALEGMALGREVQHAGHATPGNPQQDPSSLTPGSPMTFTSFIQKKKSVKPGGVLKSFPSVKNLPSIIVGKYVIAHFLENVDFRWRCLHRPTFEAQYTALSNRLRSPSTDFYVDELATLALYASCLAVGIHFLDEEGYRDLSMREEQAEDLAATCWRVSYDALEASDWMQVHDIRSVQTIIIAGIYLSSVRRANQHWTLLGSATKVAMAIGLASVPDEAKIQSGEAKGLLPRWRSAIDREVARRVWYCLLELDWLFAMEYGFLYLISPEIHQTTEPANVNDADLHEDGPVINQPAEVYTDMSYFLQRLKLFYPFQAVVQKARKAQRMHYSFVTQAHEELTAAINHRPKFYRSADTIENAADAVQLYRIKREAIALSEGADFRLMRLHRYYFSSACSNPRYLLSKQTCLGCARRLLDESKWRGNNYTNAHYWAHTMTIFAATIVTIIYLNYALPQELDEIKMHAESGINHLRSLSSKRRTDLGETADTLQSLMDLQLSRRADAHPPDLKRTLEELGGEASWDGWLPPDLVALARLNPGFMGEHNGGAGSGETPGNATLLEGQDASAMFGGLFDDLQFNDGNFIVM